MKMKLQIALDRCETIVDVRDDEVQAVLDGEIDDLSQIIDHSPTTSWDDVYNDLECVVDLAEKYAPPKPRLVSK